MQNASMATTYSFSVRFGLWLIDSYRKIAPPSLREACRFQPTCSEFARQALIRWGFWRGLRLIVRRLWLCRPPFGGVGEIPQTTTDYQKFLKEESLPDCGFLLVQEIAIETDNVKNKVSNSCFKTQETKKKAER